MRTLAEINFRDPYILPVPELGRYYLFGTDGSTAWSGTPHGFDVYISSDLQEWSGPIAAFRPAPDFWADHHFWDQKFTSIMVYFICLLLLKPRTYPGER